MGWLWVFSGSISNHRYLLIQSRDFLLFPNIFKILLMQKSRGICLGSIGRGGGQLSVHEGGFINSSDSPNTAYLDALLTNGDCSQCLTM